MARSPPPSPRPPPQRPRTRPSKPKQPTPPVAYAGLRERLYEVPVEPGNYRALALDDKRLYLLEAGDDEAAKGTLKTLAIARSAPQPETFAANVREFGLSNDRKHVFYRTFAKGAPGDMLIVDAGAKAPADLAKAKVKIDDWAVTSNPRLEWKQMFNDAWRMHRDFLYDARMRGIDWNAARTRYAPLVERVTDRAELDDVLGMMIGEVGALHSQIRPGDVRRAAAEGTPASLGAVLSRVADGYRVDHVYQSEPELPSEARSAGRARRQRERGRHHHGGQRQVADGGARHRRPAARHRRQAGAAAREERGRRSRAR